MFRVPGDVQPEPRDFGVFKVFLDERVAWLVMDRPGRSENAIGIDFQESIARATEYICDEYGKGHCSLCVLTSNKKRFCVGADISEFYHSTDVTELYARVTAGKAAFAKLSALPVPTVAAINGDALGGGLELALACDYRVALSSNKCNLGLPEVKLGVVPGLGGTVRLPQLIGIQNTMLYVLQGKSMKAKKALSIGLVDKLVPDSEGETGRFLTEVREYALSRLDKPKPPQGRSAGWLDWALATRALGRHVLARQTLRSLDHSTKGRYPAPYKAFESIMNAFREPDLQKALEFESRCFVEACVSPQAKALMSLFFLQERCKKLDAHPAHFASADAGACASVGVVGAGPGAASIGYWIAKSGLGCVVVQDATAEAAAEARAAVQRVFDEQLKAKRLDTAAHSAGLSRVSTTAGGGLKACAVVIQTGAQQSTESVRQLLRGLEAEGGTSQDTVFAADSDGPGIAELAAVAKHPENVVGMRFLQPAAPMSVVEIVKLESTSARATATAYKLALDLGKLPVVVRHSPGLLVDRILGTFTAEGRVAVQEGADPKLVQKVAADFGLLEGPYKKRSGLLIALLRAVAWRSFLSAHAPSLSSARHRVPD